MGEPTANVRRWEHRPGDQYQVIFAEVVGSNWEIERWTVGDPCPSISRAARIGFDQRGSDDFNIGVIRDGRLVATLWMDEIVDDEIDVIDEIAVATGLGRPTDNGSEVQP